MNTRFVLAITALLYSYSYSYSSLAEERELGEVFIEKAPSEQQVEFIGKANRPVDNTMIDKNSVYQDKNRSVPTEFGAGLKYHATDDFSISVEAGGELIDNEAIEVDSGSVLFELNF